MNEFDSDDEEEKEKGTVWFLSLLVTYGLKMDWTNSRSMWNDNASSALSYISLAFPFVQLSVFLGWDTCNNSHILTDTVIAIAMLAI